jgi:hypothetical protein
MDFFCSIPFLLINHTSKGLFYSFYFNSLPFFLNRYRPTQGDVVVFEAVKKAPPADLENALRWYKHIASFSDGERQK